MKKILLAISVLLAFTLCTYARKRLVILHLNDTHSHFEPIRSGGDDEGLGGVIERAAYVDSVRRADGKRNVLLLHAGDFSQGSSYFTKFGGDLEIETINAMGYDAVALGNHEFDNGIEALERRLERIGCPVLCANYDFSSFRLGKLVKPYTILRRGGMKIGIIGILTDITKVVDRSISDRMPKFDDIEITDKWAAFLKNEKKCDIVIALTHIGFTREEFTDPLLVAGTRNVDLVIGGHSHTFMEEVQYAANRDGKMIPIVQDGCWGLYVGRMEIKID